MYRIAICDSSLQEGDCIRGELEKELGKEVTVIVYRQAEDFVADYAREKEKNVADIRLMDLEFGGNRGLELAADVQRHFAVMKLIFISRRGENAEAVFETRPSDFWVRPLSKERLMYGVRRAIRELEEEDEDCFAVQVKGTVFKIYARDILYFESQKRILTLYGKEGSFVTYRKLDDVQKELPDYFLRCHQSYLVNMKHIACMRQLRLELDDGRIIPVSRPRYKEAKERFLAFLGCPPEEDIEQ